MCVWGRCPPETYSHGHRLHLQGKALHNLVWLPAPIVESSHTVSSEATPKHYLLLMLHCLSHALSRGPFPLPYPAFKPSTRSDLKWRFIRPNNEHPIFYGPSKVMPSPCNAFTHILDTDERLPFCPLRLEGRKELYSPLNCGIRYTN